MINETTSEVDSVRVGSLKRALVFISLLGMAFISHAYEISDNDKDDYVKWYKDLKVNQVAGHAALAVDVHGYYWARYDGGATHRAKNWALKSCQENSPKPETCKIMDVDGKSDYIKQRGLASAPAAVTSPAEVTANSATEPYLEWLNLHRALERALARTPDGRLFGDAGYAQNDAKNNAKRGCKRYFSAKCEIVDINGRSAADLAIPLPGSVAGIWCELPSYDTNLRVYEDTVGIAFLEQASCEKLSGTVLSGLIMPASGSVEVTTSTPRPGPPSQPAS